MTSKKIATSLTALLTIILLTSCTTQKNSEIEQPTLNSSTVKTGTTPEEKANEETKTLLQKRLKSKILGTNHSILVTDSHTGKTIFSVQENTPRLPASTMKIVTAYTTLKTFNPNDTLKTTIENTKPGHLTIVGGGDPSLTPTNLQTLTTQIVQKIATIIPPETNTKCTTNTTKNHKKCSKKKLTIHTEERTFPTPTPGPGWTNSYTPTIVRPVTSLGFLGDYTNTPAENVGKTLTKQLKKAGIPTIYTPKPAPIGPQKTVATLHSLPIKTQIKAMLWPSENNIAETLYRLVALKKGYPPTWNGAEKAALQILNENKIPTENIKLADGSGVSRQDRLTATTLNSILQDIIKTPKTSLTHIYPGPGLPTAGTNGTLQNRYKTHPTNCAKTKTRAKTGTLHDTITLAGYTKPTPKTTKIFTILTNKKPTKTNPATARNNIDKLVATINGCW